MRKAKKKSALAGQHHPHMRAATRRSAPHDQPYEVRRSRIHGRGVYATRVIPAGTRVVEYLGERISHEEADARYEEKGQEDGHTFLFVVDDKICIDAGVDGNEARYINHSCDPNAGLVGQVVLVALRDIRAGEEICFDYATSDGSPYDEFECHCGGKTCRRHVTGDDWKLPALQARYAGHFSPYIQRRIDAELRRIAEAARKRERASDRRVAVASRRG